MLDGTLFVVKCARCRNRDKWIVPILFIHRDHTSSCVRHHMTIRLLLLFIAFPLLFLTFSVIS